MVERALFWHRLEDASATLDDLREAVTTLEELERTARRIFGGAHPFTMDIEDELRFARAELRASETLSPPGTIPRYYF